MDGDDDQVRLRVLVDGRTAQATTTRTDRAGLERLVEGTIAAARLRPSDPDHPGLAGPAEFRAVRSTEHEHGCERRRERTR